MPPPRPEIRDPQIRQRLQPLDLLPDPRHRLGVENLQLEPPHPLEHRPRPQLHDHGQRRNLPHHHPRPGSAEGQLVLVPLPLQVVVRHLEGFEPFHELGAEHLPLAVEGVAPEPGRLPPAQPQPADVVELGPQVPLVDQPGQRHRLGAVDQAELDLHPRMALEHGLQHQQLVEIHVHQRADDRIDPPGVVVDARRDIHVVHPISAARAKATPAPAISIMAAASDPSMSMPRQASSSTVTPNPSRAASSAE
jgi:hypothetical protein